MMRIFNHVFILAIAGGSLLSGQLRFDVASVKLDLSASPNVFSNVPLGPGSLYPPNGGHVVIANMPLFTLIAFAYKINGDQEQALRQQLPGWVFSDRFDVEARAAGTPAKDEMRLMMRALLVDRFHLTVRNEIRQTSMFGLTLLKPGVTGPRLRSHLSGDSCDVAGGAAATDVVGGYPAGCGGLLPMPHGPGQMAKFGARNVSMQFLANQLSIMGALERHVTDETGLPGMFDFTLEWSPEPAGRQGAEGNTGEPGPGPDFREALANELGLKLVSQKGLVEFLVVDHVEHPSGN